MQLNIIGVIKSSEVPLIQCTHCSDFSVVEFHVNHNVIMEFYFYRNNNIGYDKIGSLHPVAKVIHCLLLQTLALPYMEYHLIVAN